MNRACHRIECVNDGMCGVWYEVCGVKEENLHGPEWTSLSCGGGECAPSSLFSHRSGCSGSLFELVVSSARIHAAAHAGWADSGSKRATRGLAAAG